jgi:hypothetical protein
MTKTTVTHGQAKLIVASLGELVLIPASAVKAFEHYNGDDNAPLTWYLLGQLGAILGLTGSRLQCAAAFNE